MSHPPARSVTVDVARALALLGILVNHLVGGPVSEAMRDVHAVLFATLVGVGAGLGAATGRSSAGPRAGVVRAGVLAVVGLSLAELDTRAAIVLVNLAVVTLVATWAARRPSRVVAGAAAVVVLLLPVLGLLARSQVVGPGLVDVGWTDLDEPVTALGSLLFATSYPAASWSAFGLLGVLVARHHLGTTDRDAAVLPLAALGAALLVVGRVPSILVLAVGGRTHLLDHEPLARALPDDAWRLALVGAYLPSTPSLLVSGGMAILVLAGVAALCRTAPVCRSPLTRALAALGSMTLSAYTLHVLLLPPTERVLQAHPGLDPWWLYLAHVVTLAVVLLSWRGLLPRPWDAGPLEAPTRTLVRAVTRRSGPSPVRPPAARRG